MLEMTTMSVLNTLRYGPLDRDAIRHRFGAIDDRVRRQQLTAKLSECSKAGFVDIDSALDNVTLTSAGRSELARQVSAAKIEAQEALAKAAEEPEVLRKRAPVDDDVDQGPSLEQLLRQCDLEHAQALATAAGISEDWAASYIDRVKRSARRVRRSGKPQPYVVEFTLSDGVVVRFTLSRELGLEVTPKLNVADLPHGDRCKYLAIRADIIKRSRDLCGRRLLVW